MNLRRDFFWVLAALAFAALVLPLLVYYTGVMTFGPYSRGGLLSFLGDFFADLVRLRWSAWMLLLGPVTVVLVWRLLAAYAWRKESG